MILVRFLVLIFFFAWSAPAFGQNIERVIIAHTSESISLAPLLYGIEKGFYRKEGVELEFRILRTDLASAAIVGSKEVDYMYSAGTALRVAARGLPIKVVAYTLKNILFYLMAQPNLKTIPQLKGKKIAVALPSDTGGWATKATLRAFGLDPEKMSPTSRSARHPPDWQRWKPGLSKPRLCRCRGIFA